MFYRLQCIYHFATADALHISQYQLISQGTISYRPISFYGTFWYGADWMYYWNKCPSSSRTKYENVVFANTALSYTSVHCDFWCVWPLMGLSYFTKWCAILTQCSFVHAYFIHCLDFSQAFVSLINSHQILASFRDLHFNLKISLRSIHIHFKTIVKHRLINICCCFERLFLFIDFFLYFIAFGLRFV